MFDISFGEILLICVVALVVLGPERLPAVARTLGALVARAQRFVASVKADIGQQSELAGLQSLKQQVQDTALAFKEQLAAEVDEVRQGIQPMAGQVHDVVADAQQALAVSATLPAEMPALPAATPAAEVAQPAVAEAVDSAPVPTPVAAVPADPINENQLDLFAEPSPPSLSHDTSR